mmetsp:Transcript_74199/g.164091  ORF Transcript_74199/g.164091 Transcript_74199/m.164091 type:complete len:271 (-) Transcript_74199:22-834(-)
MAFSRRCMTCWDLMPMIPPPHLLRCSALSLNWPLKLLASVSRSFWSSLLTVVSAMHDADFLCTSCPRRPLPLMMQYGTSFLRQSAGNQQTISIGSTSCAMTTSLATLFSMRVVTWFKPYLMTWGFFVFTSLPSFFCCAISKSRAFFASAVSGSYFFSSFSSVVAWFLSMAELNWLIAGGIFRRMSMIFFMRCKRTYLGHLTKRVRSRFGWMAPPRRKLRGVFSKSGFFCAFFFFSARGAEGNFLPPVFAALPILLHCLRRRVTGDCPEPL